MNNLNVSLDWNEDVDKVRYDAFTRVALSIDFKLVLMMNGNLLAKNIINNKPMYAEYI